MYKYLVPVRKWWKKYWRGVILVILAVVFFLGTSSYNYFTQSPDFVKWGAPDENANYVFTNLYAQTGEIKIFEKYNIHARDIIHPRSIRSDLGNLKPVSFLGIILIFGTIAGFTSYTVIPFLTPFFGAVGLIFFYLLVKSLFGRRNAFISAFLLASFPPLVYYSARSMFHNVLFVSLLVIGLYFSVLMVNKYKKPLTFKDFFNKKLSQLDWLAWIWSALAGLAVGLATATRTSELLWLMPAFFILWLFNIRKIGLVKLIIFLCFAFLAFLPTFYWNQILYNSPLNGGYPEMNRSIADLQTAGVDLMSSTVFGKIASLKSILADIKTKIFYFGYQPEQSWQMFIHYFVKMFYWLFWPALLGFFLFVQRFDKWKYKYWAYLSAYLLTSLILVLYYGSWEFHDNPDPNSFTIGNSYTRYWLPVYMGAIPFASMFIIRFTRALFPYRTNQEKIYYSKKNGNLIPLKLRKYLKRPGRLLLINSVRIVIVAVIFFISITFLLYGFEEGLIYSAANAKKTKQEYNKILDLNEPNSVIITQYHDKILFPQRKVVAGLFDNEKINKIYARIAEILPLYYYNFDLNNETIAYLNSSPLKRAGLKINKVEKISPQFTLYRLTVNKIDTDK